MPKQFFVPISPSIAAGWLKHHTCTHYPSSKPLPVWYKSDINKRHFTLQAETDFRPFLNPDCSGVTETPHAARRPNPPQPVKYWTKSGSDKKHFTLQPETLFRLYLASHWSVVNQAPTSICTAIRASLVEIGQRQRAIYSSDRKGFSSLFRLGLQWIYSNTTCCTD
jgi:hypothetical protein